MEEGLSARGITITFAGVDVVSNVDIDLRFGEIHAITGENGAGKSSLAKAIAGVYRPRLGEISFRGRVMHFRNPREALDEGIALIHQEPLAFPDLDVTENIFAGHHPGSGPFVSWSEAHSSAESLLATLHADLAPGANVGGLSVAKQQLVELASALSHQAKVWIFDETTAPLTPKEVAELFEIMRRLRNEGCALVIVTHRLHEVFEIADRITVLRDGKKVAERLPAESNIGEIVQLMVGRELSSERFTGAPLDDGIPPTLAIRNLSGPGFQGVTLEVRPGEIVGLAGLVGAGRTELARALFGITRPSSGEILIAGSPTQIRNPRDAQAHGIALVPEDRRQDGLLLPQSIVFNATLPHLGALSPGGWLQPSIQTAKAHTFADRLHLAHRSLAQPAGELSGGNQQKVVLSKWLMTEPKLLVLDEPTRGVDVGAKHEVHLAIRALADQGMAVLMISSDLPEVLVLGDRIAVMRQGQITAEFKADVATEENVMLAATGASSEPSATAPRATRSLRGLAPFAFLFLFCLITALKEPRFLDPRSIDSVLLWMPLITIAAMGQLMVVVTRGIDISIGSILGFSGISVGLMLKTNPHLPVPVAFAAGLGFGLALGLVNGALIVWGRLSPLIVTIGTLAAFRGLTFLISQGNQIDSSMIPDSLTSLANQGLPIGPVTVSWLLIIALVGVALAMLFLRFTRLGRNLFAFGSNPEAAHLRGISGRAVQFTVYGVSGALAGIAGVMYAARFGFVNPGSAGQSFELTVIAAVAIGGAKLTGGSGRVFDVFLGCLLLSCINVGLAVMGIDANWQMLTYGLIILVAIVIDGIANRSWRRPA